MINLVILGTIGLDDIETPFGQVKSVLGGSGTYAGIAASFFAKPGLISVAGEDLSEEHRKTLEKIDISGVSITGKTFRWSGFYEFDMNEAQTKKTELNSLAGFKPVLPSSYKDPKYLFLANIDPVVQLEVLSQMRNNPFIVLDTMNYWISNAKETLTRVIKKSNLVVMNEGEARQFFETPNLIKAGKMLLDLGPEYAIIKKGEHGALLFSDGRFFSAPGYPLEEVKDPTGAGDSFAGALIGYLVKTGDNSETNIRKAVIYGSVVASFCAEDFSLGYTKYINLINIEERYHAFEEIRRF